MSDKKLDRREFLKRLGIGAAATGTVLAGCDSKGNSITGSLSAQGEVPADKMTYRTNPKTGEKVSILGYGCMRWPTKQGDDGEIIALFGDKWKLAFIEKEHPELTIETLVAD